MTTFRQPRHIARRRHSDEDLHRLRDLPLRRDRPVRRPLHGLDRWRSSVECWVREPGHRHEPVRGVLSHGRAADVAVAVRCPRLRCAHDHRDRHRGSRASAKRRNFIVLDRFDVSTAFRRDHDDNPHHHDRTVCGERAPVLDFAANARAFVASGLQQRSACASTSHVLARSRASWVSRSTAERARSVGIWNASGTLPGIRIRSPAAGPGWRYVALLNSVSVTSGAVIAGRHSPSGAYGYRTTFHLALGRLPPSGCLTFAPASVVVEQRHTTPTLRFSFPFVELPQGTSSPLRFEVDPDNNDCAAEFFRSPFVANRNGVLNSGEARMVRTKWRAVNSSGARSSRPA